MHLSDLSEETRRRLAALEYDRFLEKHEGPFTWKYLVEHDLADFLDVQGRAVLLPIGKDRLSNITLLRAIPSADGRSLTLFLANATFGGEDNGFVAVCDRFPGGDFFVALVYHEWYVTAMWQPS